jgi:flagellar assembly protein FliH
MMERVLAADARVVALATLLERPQAVVEPAGEPVGKSAVDPRVLLEQERQRVLEEAAAAGHAEGLKRAESEISAAIEKAEARVRDANAREEERLGAATRQLQELVRNLDAEIAAVDERLTEIVVETAYAALIRMLGSAAADGALMREVCMQALLDYRQRPVVLKVAPSAVAEVAELADPDSVRVVGDARLAKGECQLETHKGVYETGIEVRLEGLKQAFLQGLRTEGA